LYNANKYHVKTKHGYDFSSDLVIQDIEIIKLSILDSVSETEYFTKHKELRDKWTNCINSLFTVVSGKDYLIPILLIKTQCFKKSQAIPTLEETKLSLVQFNNLERLHKLKATIEAL